VDKQPIENEVLSFPRAVTLVFVIGGLLAGIFLSSAAEDLAHVRHWENPALGGIIPASVAAGIVAGVIAFFALLRNKVASAFVDSSVAELQKTAWPGREETSTNTMIVVGATIFFSALLAFYDFAWAKLTGLFLYSGA
jgi:preprotein translocase SecE subunit